MTARTWPTREEWAAKAEHYVRTACLPNERVSNNPADWLTTDELNEARALIPDITKAARVGLNRAIKAVRAELGDIPTGADWYDWYGSLTDEQKLTAALHDNLITHRRQLNDSAKRAAYEHATVDALLFAWGRIGAAAERVKAAQDHAGRLDSLQRALADRRGAAAEKALTDAIAKTIARRNSDAGWVAEQERRASIDAGPLITRH